MAKPYKTVIIECKGGCLTDVRNLPEGWSWYLVDHDNQEEEDVPFIGLRWYDSQFRWRCPVCEGSNPVITSKDEKWVKQACGNCGVEFMV